jgi:hypothetical protein
LLAHPCERGVVDLATGVALAQGLDCREASVASLVGRRPRAEQTAKGPDEQPDQGNPHHAVEHHHQDHRAPVAVPVVHHCIHLPFGLRPDEEGRGAADAPLAVRRPLL